MRPPFRYLVWCAAARSLLSPIAAAAVTCTVQEEGALPVEWQRAVRALEPVHPDDDCSSVRVRAESGGVRVALTTRDGRHAERSVDAPDELAPTLAALRVTFEAEAAGEGAGDEGAATEPAKPPPAPVADTRTPEPLAVDRGPSKEKAGRDGPSDRNGTLFALSAGARGGADSLLSPVLAGAISLLRSRWEIGVTGALDFRYAPFGSTEPVGTGAGAIAAGISFGRREPVGGVELLGGARLSVAAIFHDEDVSAPADGAPVAEPAHGGPAEGRVGAYVGAAFPRGSGVRFRCDLVGDAVVGSNPPAPLTPRWAMSALAGVEFEAL